MLKAKLANNCLKMTKLWYEYVSLNHHKDCDCHWEILKTYSYGQPPKYEVIHTGYVINEDVRTSCKTWLSAHKTLLQIIFKAFCKEFEWASGVISSTPDGWDEDQKQQATWLYNHWTQIKELA